ncbi:sulfatase-like hydrolase/transferase [Rheinheimera tilapiae]|uniref:Sulfatase-like hydrolase/transferase n=1 Tax=Rheinheimera tilapiae TaxID=875043 RepID=A0ABV6BAP5_9GAMM
MSWLLPRPDRRSVWLLLGLSLLCSALELALLQHKYQLFSGGGFLQPHSFGLISERVIYVLAGWLADLSALICAFMLYNLLCRFQTSSRSHLWFALFVLLSYSSYSWLGTELFQYFGDNLDWQVLANLGGGSVLAAISMVLTELSQHLLPVIFGLLLGIALLYCVHLAFRRYRTPICDAQRWWAYAALLVLLLFPLQLQWVATAQPYRFGLEKKLSQQVLAQLINRLTDIDFDGYGAFGINADAHPLNASLYPGAMDVPGNGIDEDGIGGDLPQLQADAPDALMQLPLRAGQHIFLVVLESVRADALFANVEGQAVMPHLAALAKQGSYSEQAYSHTGFTTSSLKALFNRSLSYHPPQQNLLDALQARGYQLNVLSAQAERFGDVLSSARLKRSGQYYFDADSALSDRLDPSLNAGALRLSEQRLLRQLQQRFGEVNWQQPQFFYLNVQAAHYPYHHREMLPLLTTRAINRQQMQPANKALLQLSYYNAVANADWLIGQLQQLMQQQGIAGQSTQFYTSDHGESLFDDGFLGHGHQLNDTQTRVVLVSNRQVTYPKVLGHADLAPLILATAQNVTPPATEDAVLQVVGLVRSPQQIARVDAEGRMLYDFRQQHFRRSDEAPWQDFAQLSAADQQRAQQLINQWGWLRYQQSELYQQQSATP